MHTRWDDPRKWLLCCHVCRLARADTVAKVRLQYLFTSRAHTYMVRIGWERQPLLLFGDVHRIGCEPFEHFQTPANGCVTKQMTPGRTFRPATFLPECSCLPSCFSLHELSPVTGRKGEHAMGKLNQFRRILHGFQKRWHRHFAQLPCVRIRLANMVPFASFNLDLLSPIRLGYISRHSIA